MKVNKSVHLLNVLIAYLVLAMTDMVHHLHATFALGYESALHAVMIGVFLIPMALVMYWLFRKCEHKAFGVVFFIIVALAVVLPGIFHGGWHHVVKLLCALSTSGHGNLIGQLLPRDNLHLWFYEVSGVAELVMALACAYFVVAYIQDKPEE